MHTYSDSEKALKTYIIVLNTWDIKLKWWKSRTPFLPNGSIILPYSFEMSPFCGAPIEKAQCFMRHELDNKKATIKDKYYIALSKFLFSLAYNRTKSEKIDKIKKSKFYQKFRNSKWGYKIISFVKFKLSK